MPIGTTNTQIPGCGAHHVAVQARDWEESLRLYRDVLGMPVVLEFGTPERRIAMLDMGDGSHIELFAPLPTTAGDGPVAPSPFMHVALTTTDTRRAIEHVRQAGYQITVEPKDVEAGALKATIAFFAGPNGEIIEFFQVR
jgi:glyoxylase I family protein